MSDFVRHEMPSGAAVFYRDRDHAYYRETKQKRDGTESGSGRRIGVSTASKPLDYRPDNLMKWAARSNGEGISILAADGLSLEEADDIRGALSWLESGDAIWDALTEAELTWQHLRDRAAKRGTAVHELVLRELAEGRIPSLADVSAEERAYGQAVIRFWRDHDPEPLQVEQVICSEEHDYAGRFDLRAKIGDEVWLLDAKTSNYIGTSDHAQIQGYEIAARECGFGPSDRQVILRLDAEGNYELIDSTAEASDFLAALGLYRRAKRIDSEARKARKAREKVPA